MSSISSTRNIKVLIPIHTRLKTQAASEGRKLQDVIEEALLEYLNVRESKDEVIELHR